MVRLLVRQNKGSCQSIPEGQRLQAQGIGLRAVTSSSPGLAHQEIASESRSDVGRNQRAVRQHVRALLTLRARAEERRSSERHITC